MAFSPKVTYGWVPSDERAGCFCAWDEENSTLHVNSKFPAVAQELRMHQGRRRHAMTTLERTEAEKKIIDLMVVTVLESLMRMLMSKNRKGEARANGRNAAATPEALTPVALPALFRQNAVRRMLDGKSPV